MSVDSSIFEIKIHVIVPVYNAKEYLYDAVDSILKQPYKGVEIVLIDDGSTDESNVICDKIAEINDRVSVIHQKNSGVSIARNRGIEFALSKSQEGYIAFLDADDSWSEGFLNIDVLNLLKNGYHLIGFQSCVCDALMKRKKTSQMLAEGEHKGGEKNVWLHAAAHFGAMFYSKKLLDEYHIRFLDGLEYSEDKIFSIQCMYLANSIFLKNKLMYLYRVNVNSAMGRRSFGIPYYEPIIKGYLALDLNMEKFINEERGVLLAGRYCANRYIMNMVAEHYQKLRSKKSIEEFFVEHASFIDVVSAQGNYSMLRINPEYQRYLQNKFTYIIKMYAKGLVFHLMRFIFRLLK